MLRNKRTLLIIILAVALFLIPNMCNAETFNATETTKTSTGVEVKWSYELSENNEILNLLCLNVDAISGSLNIPSSIDGYTVKTIGNTANEYSHYDGAFENCVGLISVTIPDTVTKIGTEAFKNCGLQTVNLPNTITKIGVSAFEDCAGIKSINIANGATEIGKLAFKNSGLQTVSLPNTITKIGDYAFESCTGLKEVIIPDSVTSLGMSAFKSCTKLEKLTLSKNLTQIKESTFHGCTALREVIIPKSVSSILGEYTVDKWGDNGAFASCSNLRKVYIPDEVATIEKGAFSGCSKLTIFGNDNQASKEYAEENDINFDYIANWDEVGNGDDITPPTLKDLKIEFSHSFEYDEGTTYYLAPTGMNISIKAYFEEEVYGETAPTLTIKCGNGENITLTNGVIQGEYIVYTYTIKNKDKGIISAVSMTGGDIKDKAGNLAKEYTCPKLTTSYIIGENFVFANGTDSIIENEQNNNQNQNKVTLSSIAISLPPNKVNYTEGETFNKTGMMVAAHYSDGHSRTVTDYTYLPSVALKPSDTKVVISYTENGVTKTVEQKITVLEKGANNNDSNSSNNSNFKDDTTKDTTTKNDNKLPQTGTTVLITLALISLTVVAVISKVKCGKYKDI